MSPLNLTDREFFAQSLPDFTEEYPNSRYALSVLFNHIHVAYFLDDVEIHSAKFYTACLSESDVVNEFLEKLGDDVEAALIWHTSPKLRALFDSPSPFAPEAPTEPKYVVNIQPLLDAAPHIPGLVKSHDPLLPHDDDDFTYVQYTFADGYPVSDYGFSPDAVKEIYDGTYEPDQTDDASSFIDSMESAIEELLAIGFIKEATS